MQSLAHCDYFSESQGFFKLIFAWLLYPYKISDAAKRLAKERSELISPFSAA